MRYLILGAVLYFSFVFGRGASAEMCTGMNFGQAPRAELARKLRFNLAYSLISNPGPHVEADSNKAGSTLAENFRACMQRLNLTADGPDLCLQRANDLVQALSQKMQRDDKNEFTKIPDWVSSDPQLQNAMKAFDVDAIQRQVNELNRTRREDQKILLIKIKTSIGSFIDNDYRLIIVDPANNGMVTWFTLDQPRQGGPATDQMGLISYNPQSKLWYANDHYHSGGGFQQQSQADKACIRCHSSGPISPASSQLAGKQWEGDLNRMRQLLKPDLKAAMQDGSVFDFAKMGPKIGEFMPPGIAERERGPEFFRKCLSEYPEGQAIVNSPEGNQRVTAISNKIRPLMNCASCHNGQARPAMPSTAGSFHYPLGIVGGEPPDLVRFRIGDGSMPKPGPGHWVAAGLDPTERKILANCLAFENYGLIPERESIPTKSKTGGFTSGWKTAAPSPARGRARGTEGTSEIRDEGVPLETSGREKGVYFEGQRIKYSGKSGCA